MICQESYVDFLQALPENQLDVELRQRVTDSLQELVAGIEEAARERAQWFRSCMIDDFQITRAKLMDERWMVLILYTASAQRRGRGAGRNECIYGSALLSIDAVGDITYKGVTFNEEHDFATPDVGVGD